MNLTITNKFFVFCTFFFIIFISMPFCGIGKPASQDIAKLLQKQVSSNFNHANTYYWYGRYKANTLHEFQHSSFYLTKADSLLALMSRLESNDDFITEYKRKIAEMRQALAYIDTICIDNLNGRFPLYNEFAGLNSEYEYWDAADELAVEKSLKKLLDIPVNNLTNLGQQMYFSFIVVLPEDNNMAEIAQQYLNSNTSHYIISQHELAGILSKKELDSLMSNNISRFTINKIADYFKTENVGMFLITQNDYVNGLYYYGTKFTLFSNSSTSMFDKYTEGFRYDKMRLKNVASIFTLVLSLFVLLIFVVFLVNSNDLKKRFPGLIIFLVSIISGLLLLLLLNYFLQNLYPLSSFYYDTPTAFCWRIAFSIAGGCFNLLLLFVLAGKFYKKALLNYSMILAFVMPAIVSYGLLQADFSVLVLGFTKEVVVTNVLFIISVTVVSFFIAKAVYFLLNERDMVFQSVSLTLFLILVTSLIFYNFKYFQPENTMNIISWSTFLFFPAVTIQHLFLFKKRPPHPLEEKKYLFSASDFTKYLNDNPHYIPPENFEDQVDEVINLFDDNTSLINLIIEGHAGTGKTRYSKELLASLVKKQKNEIKIFEGNCEEDIGGNVRTYQVLMDAFSDSVGKGKFKDPGRTVNKFLEHVKNTPLESYLGLFLKGKQHMLSHEEVADSLFFDLMNKKGDIYVVVDNIQWIDEPSATVLINLISKFIRLNGTGKFKKLNKKILFVFITQSTKGKNPTPGYEELLRDIGEFTKIEKEFRKKDIDEQYYFVNNFAEKFIKNMETETPFHFNYSSKRKINNFFNKIKVSKPKDIISFFQLLTVNELLRFENQHIILNKKVNFTELFETAKISEDIVDVDSINPKLRQMLETAAFIGESFDANILGKIWDIDRLELFHLLRHAEIQGIVVDQSPYDDIYQFTSEETARQFRNLSLSSINSHYNGSKLVQEYNNKIIEAIEELYDKGIENYPDDLVFSLAKRSFVYQVIDKEKILKYNQEAGLRCMNIGRFEDAIDYFSNALKIVTDFFPDNSEQLIRLKISMAQATIKAGVLLDKDFLSENEIAAVDNNEVKAQFLLTKALALNRIRHKEDFAVLDEIEQILRAVPKTNNKTIQYTKIFYLNYFVKINQKNNSDKALKALRLLLKTIEKSSVDEGLKELLLQIYNSMSFVTDESNKLICLDKAMYLLAEKLNSNRLIDAALQLPVHDDTRREMIAELVTFQDDLSPSELKSLSFLLYGYASYFLKLNNWDVAGFYLSKGIEVNERSGDSKGLVSILYLMTEKCFGNSDLEGTMKYLEYTLDEALINNDLEYLTDVIKFIGDNNLMDDAAKYLGSKLKNGARLIKNNSFAETIKKESQETIVEYLDTIININTKSI